MMGYSNAQVGDNNQDIKHIMGKHEMPCKNENENRQFLIELCGKHGLLIGGTVFLHRDCHKVTWVSPDKDNQSGKPNRPHMHKSELEQVTLGYS
jgi:hypothetical protein